ncbi:MAG: hypothetical protein HUU29_06950 [Planctomycetaceae bacterium]|nr:hypothetical protein [Planctomycetaceae bacterium]
MKLRILGGFLAIVCAFAPALDAQKQKAKFSPAVGEEATDLGEITWVMNEPETDSLAGLKGEVVMLEIWGTR